MFLLIDENEKARIVQVSQNPDQYQVIEDAGSKPFDDLSKAKGWFKLISNQGEL